MIQQGNATIFVADFDRAFRFYTETLGFETVYRAGEHWAEVRVGDHFSIGIHPASESAMAPGTEGAMHIGLVVSGPLETRMEELAARGVAFEGGIVGDGGNRFVNLRDPDGNRLYLWELAS
ncbi:MAG: VOC family protein [Planctomycetota bacterium]